MEVLGLCVKPETHLHLRRFFASCLFLLLPYRLAEMVCITEGTRFLLLFFFSFLSSHESCFWLLFFFPQSPLPPCCCTFPRLCIKPMSLFFFFGRPKISPNYSLEPFYSCLSDLCKTPHHLSAIFFSGLSLSLLPRLSL